MHDVQCACSHSASSVYRLSSTEQVEGACDEHDLVTLDPNGGTTRHSIGLTWI